MQFGLSGPAPVHEKIMWRTLKRMGVTEAELPNALKNTIVKRSKKGPIGAIVVRKMTGVDNNSAAKTLKQFEKNVGGKDDVAEKLEAVKDSLSREQTMLLALLKGDSKRSLAHLAADAKAEPTGILRAYAQGCIELGKVGAAIEAHRNLPGLIKGLYKMAMDHEKVCGVCGGTGFTKNKSTDREDKLPCPICNNGVITVESDHKEFAITKLLDVTKMTEKGGPTVNVNTAIGVRVDGKGNGDFFSRMVKTSDEILYSRPRAKEDVVDAEIVGEA